MELFNSSINITSNYINVNQAIPQLQDEIFVYSNIKLFIGYCKNCNLNKFYSLFIEINQFLYSSVELLEYLGDLEDTTNKQSLLVNDIISDKESKGITFVGYKNITIKNVNIISIANDFAFYNITTLKIQNLIIDPNLKFDCFLVLSLQIVNCRQIVIEKFKTTLTNLSKPDYFPMKFTIKNCKQVIIREFILNSLMINSQLFEIEQCDNTIFEDFQLYDVRYIQPPFVFKSNVSFNRMKIIHYIQDIKDSEIITFDKYQKNITYDDSNLKAVLDLYSGRSLIQIHSGDSDQDLVVLIQEVYADFGGYNSRFLNVDDQIILKRKISVKIKNSNFFNMQSDLNGGCIRMFMLPYSTPLTIQIQFSTFYNCSSYAYGGAIYTNGHIALENVIIQKSKSKFGGALVIFHPEDLKELNVTYIDNYSKYFHKDVFLFCTELSFDEIIEFSEINYNQTINQKYQKIKYGNFNLIPGIVYILPFKMKTIQYPFKQPINYEKDSIIFEQNKGEPLFQNLFEYVKSDDKLIPYLMTINQNQYDQYPYLLIKIDSKNKNYSGFTVFNSNSEFYFKFNLQNCTVGQKIINYGFQSSELFDCQYCPYMSTSYTLNSTKCDQCDPIQFEYCYSNISQLNVGYYRKYLTVNKTQVYECKNNQNSCKGGEGYGNDLCAKGHIGIECKSCDIIGKYWNETFGKNGYYSCTRCSEIKHNLVFIIILFILFIGATYLIICSNTKSIELLINQIYLSKLKIVYLGKSVKNLELTFIYVKILSFYVSILYMAQQQMSLRFKSALLDISIQSQNPLVEGYVSIDCALSERFATDESYNMSKLLFFILFPILAVPIMILLLFIKLIFKQIQSRQFKYSSILSIVYLTFIVFYNSILSIIFDALFCRTFQSGDKQSLLDLSISCDNIKLNQFVVIPTLIGYCIGIPLFIIFALIYNRKRLQSIKIMFLYGFLYKDYKEKYFFWEIIRFSVKVGQLIASKLFISNFINMNCINIIILILYFTTLLIFKPFLRSQINQLELISVLINILIIFSLIIFQNQLNSDEKSIYPEIILMISQYLSFLYIIGLFILIINSFFDVLIGKMQRYVLFSRIFRCNFCQKKNTKNKRAIENLKFFYQAVRKLIKRNRGKNLELEKFSYFFEEKEQNEENQETVLQNENEQNLNEEIILLKQENQDQGYMD